MHTVDVLMVCAAAVVIVLFAGVLARQRYLLRLAEGLPIAVWSPGGRWSYGIARFAGAELRWYRAIGLGIRPSRVLRRSDVQITSRRSPDVTEASALPATAVVVECSDDGQVITLAFSASAFIGFVSWLEASSSRP